MTAPCYIGTSGWNYKHWANGRFYPPRFPQRRWLEFYARRFNTVEVNNSFYQIPKPETAAKWTQAVPEGFTFALKLWRGITHYRKLHDSGDLLDRFLDFARPVAPPHRAPLLVQLPPSMGANAARLDEFLALLAGMTRRSPWKVAVEFRSCDWLTDEVYAVLDRHDAAAALSDHGRCLVDRENAASFVYVRRHGAGPEGRYHPKQIGADARRVRAWLRAKRPVYVYYNNDLGGHAVDNAGQLMEAVGVPPPIREPDLFS